MTNATRLGALACALAIPLLPQAASGQAPPICLESSRTLLGYTWQTGPLTNSPRVNVLDATQNGFLPVDNYDWGRTWGQDNQATDIAFGDFDGDGIDELAYSRKADRGHRVRVVDDPSQGGRVLFETGDNWPDSSYGTAVAFGDFDGDGVDELAFGRKASKGGFRIRVVDDFNAGTGMLYETGHPWGGGNYPTSLAFGNYDSDPGGAVIDELAFARKSDRGVRVRVIDSEGTILYEAGDPWGSGNYATSVAFGNFVFTECTSCRQYDELAYARKTKDGFRVRVVRLVGVAEDKKNSVVYEAGSIWGDGNFATSVALGDIDGDGEDELGYTRNTEDHYRVRVIRRDGTIPYEVGDPWGEDNYARELAFGDTDGDGNDEIAYTRRSGDGHRLRVVDNLESSPTPVYENATPGLDQIALSNRRQANGADADGDGLLDVWETNGMDMDCDGTVDVDLPTLGANPQHKDMFVELDWTLPSAQPTQSTIRALKTAFRAAPINAGGTANPDGLPGINVWVDTGGTVDLGRGVEGGGSCSDGIDNEMDGLTDELDPDCLFGYGREGVGPCNDGVDNDGDGMVDNNCSFIGRDPIGIEGAGLCNDGVDNDGANGQDANDPSCLVGDPVFQGALGNGGLAAGTPIGISGVDDNNFYTVKRANFSRQRSFVFRYGILARGFDPAQQEGGAGPASCGDGIDNDGDGDIDCADAQCECYRTGGQAELGGNDFLVLNRDPGTLMHEIGHTLNLGHGGPNNHHNCKPNYVSVMNYDHQFGIAQQGQQLQDVDANGILENSILDFAPPRHSAGRTGGYPNLVERQLVESVILDAGDADNQTLFVDGNGALRQAALTGTDLNGDGIPDGFDWTGDGTLNAGSVSVDIDRRDSAMTMTCMNPPCRSEACEHNNGRDDDALTWGNDWNAIAIPFRQFGDATDSFEEAINPSEPDPSYEELRKQRIAGNTADLEVLANLDASEVVVGDSTSLSVGIENLEGTNARNTELTITVPEGILIEDLPTFCRLDGGDILCALGVLKRSSARHFDVTVVANTAGDGDGRQLEFDVDIRNGRDPYPSNNSTAVTLFTRPQFASFEDSERPWEHYPPWWTSRINYETSHSDTAIEVAGCGLTVSTSPQFNTLEWERVSDTIAVDVFIPHAHYFPWVGGLSLATAVSDTDVFLTTFNWDGSLDALPRGQWSTVRFAVPQAVQTIFEEDHNNARMALHTMNTSCLGPILIDNVRFE